MLHPLLAEISWSFFLDPWYFWVELSNSSNGIEKKSQIRQLSFVLSTLQKVYLLCVLIGSLHTEGEQKRHALGWEDEKDIHKCYLV